MVDLQTELARLQKTLIEQGYGFPATLTSIIGASPTAQAWSSANRAYWWRLRDGGAITSLGFFVGVQSGNMSLSINAGVRGRSGPGAARWASGAFAVPAAGDASVAIGSTVIVYPGDWIGMSCDNTTAAFRSVAPGMGIEAWMLGHVAYKDTSHPIPATAPAAPSYRGDRIVALYGA